VDLSGVISSLASGTYTVTRYGAGSYTNGRWADGATSSFTIKALIYPAVRPFAGREVEHLPEGQRSQEAIEIFTSTALRTGEGAGGVGADVVSYNGKSFFIESVEYWNGTGNFYKCVGRKTGQ
jgi:hypothetical protein